MLFGSVAADLATRAVLELRAEKFLVREQMTDLLARIHQEAV